MLNNSDIFEYTGEGCAVPIDVTIVRFHRSVVEVEKRAFRDCQQLREMVFNDGLQKIGVSAFLNCTSLQALHFPLLLLKLDNVHLAVAIV